ncbi:gliding motility protein GldL [Xanthovirga aplysinae]|uniref:type IX secretion system motor protein PorL/GldL n=1 Tax=Xanthovirga aplysinae TaxID=2529853 RepID=UPI0012BD028E|nr:gliding motility protein GldL [Xanthovirga aplysinae]MTI33324.1 gliding motility protein GldL [Xanthovirga aplysinae]
MSRQKGGAAEKFYGFWVPKLYGIGAAIVIVGAMFKLEHWPFASELLITGLTTEAVIFFLSAFEPKHVEPDWTKVYPELADDFSGTAKILRTPENEGSVSKKLDHMLESANVGPELIESLGKGMKNLSNSVAKMSTVSDAVVATDEYSKNIKVAASSLNELNRSYAATTTAMTQMVGASEDVKKYHAQVQHVTKNLSALNAVYEMELQDTNSHIKAMNKFYSNIAATMGNMSETTKDTQEFREELGRLKSNLSSLNKVYGSMLTAMKS